MNCYFCSFFSNFHKILHHIFLAEWLRSVVWYVAFIECPGVKPEYCHFWNPRKEPKFTSFREILFWANSTGHKSLSYISFIDLLRQFSESSILPVISLPEKRLKTVLI
jgi:hypothetical protein